VHSDLETPSSRASELSSGSAKPSAEESHSGALTVNSLSDLVILGPIGQGASGLVQKACLRRHPDRFLALKVVPLDLSEAKSKAVLVELRTLHYAAHPNIVDFFGAFHKERSISLVLEYMDQGSLSDCLKRLKALKLKQQKKRRERKIRRQQRLLEQHQQQQQQLQANDAPPAAPPPLHRLPSPSSPVLSGLLVSEAHISCIARQLLSGLHYLHNTRRLIHRDIKPSNILINSKGEVKLAGEFAFLLL